MYTTHGLCDLQINGFAGIDFNDSDNLNAASLDRALEAMLATGVTTCLPTLISADIDTLAKRFAVLDNAVNNSFLGRLMIPGYHLEGPFLNPAEGYCGCHPSQMMRSPDTGLILELEAGLSRPILLITYAPELDLDGSFTHQLSQKGKLLSIGHSAAQLADVQRVAQFGASMSTHLGNGLPHQLHKLDNPIFAQLSNDALMAGFIADGVHISPHVLKVLLRAKGIERSILVTDAVSAAAQKYAGFYAFAGMQVERTEDGTVRVPGSDYLAGSSLTMDTAVRNVVAWAEVSFEQAITMSSDNPRRLLASVLLYHGISLAESKVVWNDNLAISEVSIGTQQRTYTPATSGETPCTYQ
ncbi:N-acetylglucosamine-6-phosphate deacetylase [Yersinia wautersii]|uniref:N-acetylglucosamine-6-phosphate deacetylase n=1 Tax=Yersinia wautersii TaxID=1341643 RepID=A0ABM9TJ59_9GAMM|nr:hypothetical protein [Yersinia wautersii]CRG52116.1 N-acetylglucosamine-6-phosphate deacetylase [Yersinia wautersii]